MISDQLQRDFDAGEADKRRILTTSFVVYCTIGACIVIAYLIAVRNDVMELARTAGTMAVSLVFAVGLGHHTSYRIDVWHTYVVHQITVHKTSEVSLPSFIVW